MNFRQINRGQISATYMMMMMMMIKKTFSKENTSPSLQYIDELIALYD